MINIDILIAIIVVVVVLLFSGMALTTQRENKKWDNVARRYENDDVPFGGYFK